MDIIQESKLNFARLMENCSNTEAGNTLTLNQKKHSF